VEGLGKKRDPTGFEGSMDGVDGLVDGAVEGAKDSIEDDWAKPEAGWPSGVGVGSCWVDRAA